MHVEVELKETSQRIVHDNAENTYTKGPMFCVYAAGRVYKYPVANVWRVVEDYGRSGRTPDNDSSCQPEGEVMQLKQMIEVAQVLDKYLGDGVHYLSAEHDEIFLPGPPPDEMSAEDRETLENNHVSWQREYDSWHTFT